jgi:hypothetical protein
MPGIEEKVDGQQFDKRQSCQPDVVAISLVCSTLPAPETLINGVVLL